MGESSGGVESNFTRSMPKSYKRYAQADTSNYQGNWGSYNVLDSEMIEGQKTLSKTCKHLNNFLSHCN